MAEQGGQRVDAASPRALLNGERGDRAEVAQGAERKSNGGGAGPSRCKTPEGDSLPGWPWSGVLAAAAGHQPPETVCKARGVQAVRQGRILSLPGPLQWRPPRVRSTGTLILPISLKTCVHGLPSALPRETGIHVLDQAPQTLHSEVRGHQRQHIPEFQGDRDHCVQRRGTRSRPQEEAGGGRGKERDLEPRNGPREGGWGEELPGEQGHGMPLRVAGLPPGTQGLGLSLRRTKEKLRRRGRLCPYGEPSPKAMWPLHRPDGLSI